MNGKLEARQVLQGGWTLRLQGAGHPLRSPQVMGFAVTSTGSHLSPLKQGLGRAGGRSSPPRAQPTSGHPSLESLPHVPGLSPSHVTLSTGSTLLTRATSRNQAASQTLDLPAVLVMM